jgi:hypothetical protein
MEYTQQQKDDFVAAYAATKRKQIIATVLVTPLMILFTLYAGEANPKSGIAFGISAVIALPILGAAIVSYLFFTFRNWRCPACNRYLGKGFNPSFCPKCGVQLKK